MADATDVDDLGARSWHEIVRDVLKRHDVELATYVPDNVLRPLIEAIEADPFFTAFACTREEEALGINAGAWMGGLRGILLMQTSGFATLANVIASLSVPFQIPTLMMVSERGTLGEFNVGQSLVARTMRPVLDALCIETHTMTRLDEAEFILDRSLVQSFATKAPVCFILSPLLTGGKIFAKWGSDHGAFGEPPAQAGAGKGDEPVRHHPADDRAAASG